MLLDEVTSALDPEVIGEVLKVIRLLNSEHQPTMLMVTHQMGFAREISDRVCFFYEGRIAGQGTPDQIIDDPRNERTKQFLSAVLNAREASGSVAGGGTVMWPCKTCLLGALSPSQVMSSSLCASAILRRELAKEVKNARKINAVAHRAADRLCRPV